MSRDLFICKVFLSKVYSQRVKIMHQRGETQNQPKAGLEIKMEESASHHNAKLSYNHSESISYLYHCPDQFRTEGCEALSFFLKQCESSVKWCCFLQYFLNLWILANASKILIGIIKVTKITKFRANLKFNEMHLRALKSSFYNALIA